MNRQELIERMKGERSFVEFFNLKSEMLFYLENPNEDDHPVTDGE